MWMMKYDDENYDENIILIFLLEFLHLNFNSESTVKSHYNSSVLFFWGAKEKILILFLYVYNLQ